MALQKQHASLPLVADLDTKSDIKQLKPGAMSVVENASYANPGRLSKRNGYGASLGTADIAGNSISLTATAESEQGIVGFTGKEMYAYDSVSGKWVDRGVCNNASITSYSSTSLYYPYSLMILGQDHISVGSYDIFASTNLSTKLYYTIVDRTTGSTVVSTLSTVTAGAQITSLQLGYIGTTVLIFYHTNATTNISFITVPLTAPFTETAAVTPITDMYTTDGVNFGTVSDGTKIALCYVNGATSIKTSGITTIGGTIGGSNSYVCDANSIIRDVNKSSDGKLIITSYSTNTTHIKIASQTFSTTNFTTVLAYHDAYDASANTEAPFIATSQYCPLTDAYYTISGDLTPDSLFHLARLTGLRSNGTLIPTLKTFYRAVPQGQIFFIGNELYVPIDYRSFLQPTILIKRLVFSAYNSVTSSTMLLLNQSSISLANAAISQVVQRVPSLTSTTFSYLTSTVADSFTGQPFYISNILSFGTAADISTTLINGGLHIANGYLKYYDGVSVVENGFFFYPEGLLKHSTTTVGGSLSDGTYLFYAVYKWIDSLGLIHRSAPSPALSVVLNGGGSSQLVVIRAPTVYHTDKSNISIEIYRTAVGGTIPYLVDIVDNSTSTYYVDSNNLDGYGATTILSQPTLYTVGGVLENIAPFPSTEISSYVDRVYTIKNSNTLQYSLLRQDGFPLSWNDTNLLFVNETGGAISAIENMDGNLIIFKQNSAIFYISGSGPNNLGQSNNFSDAIRIASDIGCSNRASVVLTPMGIFFQSTKGICLLDRSLQVQYIGSPVDSFNSLTITSAQVINNKNLVVFSTSEGTWLNYNYFSQKWSTSPSLPSYDARVIGTNNYYLSTTGTVYKQGTGFADPTADVVMKIETGWISFAGIQGFQRVYNMMILGEYKSAHSIKVSVAYDYVDSYTQTVTTTSASMVTSPYELQINFATQKCKAIKIKIEDVPNASGESFSLSNIMFTVGVSSGHGSLPSTNKTTAV